MPGALRRCASLLGLLLLSGCAWTAPPTLRSGSAPTAAPGATASVPPSASPIPTGGGAPSPPLLPAQARTPDERGAAALVTHFGDLLQHAETSGDTAALAALSDDGCASCLAIRQDLEQTRQAGGHEEGGALHVLATGSLPPVDGRTRVAVFVAHDASTRVMPDGPATRVVSRDAAQWELHLMWVDTGWRVMTITHTSPEMAEALRTAEPGTVIDGG